jgi:ferric-dicitrate binding protein FerR (iron transport regulator)
MVGSLIWLTTYSNSHSTLAAKGDLQEWSTRRGQRATLQLGDGTRITLAAASKLRYLRSSDTTRVREVMLEGEAYFEVPHDAKRLFLVRTKSAVARDLGTKFLVRSYPETEYADVVVAEGAVSLSPASEHSAPDSVVLGPAQLGRVDTGGHLWAARSVDLGTALAWTRGELVFHRTPVPDAVAEINRWYDADIRVGDRRLRAIQFSAAFNAEPLTQVVDVLAAAIGARAERRGNTITLIPR